jgi:hypothetical protein
MHVKQKSVPLREVGVDRDESRSIWEFCGSDPPLEVEDVEEVTSLIHLVT